MAAALLADSQLVGMVDSTANEPSVIPDELLPQGLKVTKGAVLIVEGAGADLNALSGAAGLEWVTVELHCLARSRKAAGRLRVAARQAVQAQLGGREFGPFKVQKFSGEGRSAAYLDPREGESVGYYVAVQQYKVWLTKPDGM
jgi:hypothetical protein